MRSINYLNKINLEMKYKYSFMTYTDHIYNGLPCNPNLRYQKIFHKNKKFQRVLKEILTWTWILQEMMVFFFTIFALS